MNGINYNTLLGNKGLFPQSDAAVEDKKVLSRIAGAKEVKTEKQEEKQNRDTVEINGQSREIPKAGYERPKRVAVEETKQEETTYKALNEEGIQEGVELSEAAKNLLAELKEKYADMDFAVVNWSTDEEQDYYASMSQKQYSVLIAPEALEAMAADEEVRAKYEAILDGAGKDFEQIKEELGEDAEQIESFSITIDKDGKVSYAVQLLKDLAKNTQTENAKKAKEAQEERIEKRREEKKEAQEERLEKIEADSVEELIAAIKQRLHPEQIVVEENEDTEQSVEESAAVV